MPRTRKNTRWMVAMEGKLLTGIQSKTYIGACCKAFKKWGIDVLDHPTLISNKVDKFNAPHTIQYSKHFEGVYCVAMDF